MTIPVKLDAVNKKQARFISDPIRVEERRQPYTDETKKIEVPRAVVYLDTAAWQEMGRPNELHVEDYTGA